MALKHSFIPSSTSCTLQANHYSYALHPLRIGRNPISLRPFSQSSSPSFSNSSIPRSTPSSLFLSFLEEDDDDEEEVVDEEEERVILSETQQLNPPDNDPIRRFFQTRTADQESEPDPGCQGKLSLQENRKTSWHLASIIASTEDDDDEVEHIPNSLLETLPSTPRIEGIVSQIVGKAKSLPENVTLGEVLGEFEGRVVQKDCEEVLGLLGNEGLAIDCLYFFEWMGLNEPSLVTPRAYKVLFLILGRAGMSKELLVLFKNLPNGKGFRDVHVYNAAISGLLCCRRYDDAWEVYQSMETNSVQPDHVTCSIMITIMRKRGNSAKEAWELFEKMNKEGVKWSLEVAGALIKSFGDEGLKKEALIIQLEMEKREMKRKRIAPTSVTYNTLMDAYSRRLQPDVVEKLLQEMEDAGLEPNVKSYTCLISAYGRLKKMSDLAANAFLRMTKVGIKPNSYSYTALIHAYSVSGWHDKAYTAFENMQREGINPSIETYTALLDAFRRAGDTQTLMKIWKLMIREKIEGTRVTFNILLDGFAKQGCYVEARDVICEFGKLGLRPTVMTYNMLINAYARGGQESRLPQLLKEMAALNLKPDSITYSTMIYAFIRVRDFKRAFYFHKQMVKNRQVPDVESYEKLRVILDVKAAVKNRKDKSALMGIVRSSMGLLKEKKKGKKDEFWKNRKKGSRFRGGQ
ncbi:pentatricopeptide repeat-containing protein At5g50280, chloroplastic isoform X2 [Solanum dulcamara]|uniref:pentatricopeptide repeat-containing protein At5g50280, chloroplastic isoform X2 n=1 Tax=Solanum dulcamara TaxID=45834 RepID=UPI002485BC38|nr:pentatricopeptide repeat-containing protein At5g50280, chloroplastic isoform X2 [Solanum dulcamara]